MKTLQLEESKAKKLFKDAPEWFKQTLISSFGAACFSENIKDRIKTFADAYAEADDETKRIYDMSVTSPATEDELAYKQLKLIIKVINEGWMPDWNNTNQKKWFPYFALSSGFGFSYSYYYYSNAHTSVGSRLCFKSEELSTYVGNQFLNLYEQFLTIK